MVDSYYSSEGVEMSLFELRKKVVAAWKFADERQSALSLKKEDSAPYNHFVGERCAFESMQHWLDLEEKEIRERIGKKMEESRDGQLFCVTCDRILERGETHLTGHLVRFVQKKEEDLCFSPHCEHNKVSPGTEKERCAWGNYTKDCSDFVCGKPSVGHYRGTPMCVEHLPKEESEQKFESHRACCFLMKSMGACILQRGHLGSHKDSLGGKEEVSLEEKQITNEELDRIADAAQLLIKVEGVKFYIARQNESVFILSEMADLMEKIKENEEFITKETAMRFVSGGQGIDWLRLFRERPDLVEKIRKGHGKRGNPFL